MKTLRFARVPSAWNPSAAARSAAQWGGPLGSSLAGLTRLASLATFVVLAACGGGGDSSPDTRISADRSSITVTSAPVESGPTEIVRLQIANLPGDGLYGGADTTRNGVMDVQIYDTGETTAELAVRFRPGVELAEGTYTDTVTVDVCHDDACARPVAGSPLRITTRYTIAANSTVRIDRNDLSASATTVDAVAPVASVMLTTGGASPASALHVEVTTAPGPTYFTTATKPGADPTTVRLDFQFTAPSTLPAGRFEQTATLRVCYDRACRREVTGSPQQVLVQYTVRQGAPIEPGVAPLVVSSRTALAHDVVDAEFSRALNAVVIVSSWPAPALQVVDAVSGQTRTLALNRLPVAVSVSPDGLSAAVGHDALVTHVDLATVGTATPSVRTLNLSAVTGDLVLDGRGHVFVFPRVDQWVSVHSIDVATNTETLRYGPYAGTRARLHPSGTRLYAANNGLSPDDIENYDISTGVATRVADSPYHGDYPMCGDVWPSEDGQLLYTACGRAFRASALSTSDMVYAGALSLSPSTYYGWRIISLSHRQASREIALIERPWYECTVMSGGAQCFSHLAIYESEFLNRQAVYSLPPVEVAEQAYPQQGLFVFHRADGVKVLISRLTGMPNPAAEYHLSLVP